MESYEDALDSDPLDPLLLRNCAETRVKLYVIEQKLKNQKNINNTFVENEEQVLLIDKTAPEIIKADSYFSKALRADPDNPHHYIAYANFLKSCGRYSSSEDNYLESLEINPNIKEALKEYAELLRRKKYTAWAELFEKRMRQL